MDHLTTAIKAEFEAEMQDAFRQGYSILRDCCITENVGGAFLVPNRGGAARSRIPATPSASPPVDAPLVELAAALARTGRDMFTAKADRRVMQDELVGIFNRQIDQAILDALGPVAAVNETPCVFTREMLRAGKDALSAQDVPIDDPDNIFGVITPAARAYLLQTSDFAAGEYVDMLAAYGRAPRRIWRWENVNWLEHIRLRGVGSTDEHCYLFHRNAIGDAVDVANLRSTISCDDRAEGWIDGVGAVTGPVSSAAATIPHQARILQAAGAVRWRHDGAAYAA